MHWSSILVAFLFLSCCLNHVDSRLLPREDGSVSVVSVAREESPAAGEERHRGKSLLREAESKGRFRSTSRRSIKAYSRSVAQLSHESPRTFPASEAD